jgi:hypothetical protein
MHTVPHRQWALGTEMCGREGTVGAVGRDGAQVTQRRARLLRRWAGRIQHAHSRRGRMVATQVAATLTALGRGISAGSDLCNGKCDGGTCRWLVWLAEDGASPPMGRQQAQPHALAQKEEGEQLLGCRPSAVLTVPHVISEHCGH